MRLPAIAVLYSIFVVLWFGRATPSLAQEHASELSGYLVQLGKNDEPKPVVGAVVSVHGIGNPTRTTERGFFRLPLPGRLYRPGQQVILTVQAPGWQLYQPEGGVVTVPAVAEKQPIVLKLLPLGSKRFLDNHGIVELLRRAMSEVKDQSARSAQPSGQPPPLVNLKGPIQKWALEYGLSVKQVQEAVDAWATEVLKHADTSSEEPCLAQFAKERFADSAPCFELLGQSDLRELDKLQHEVIKRTEQAVRHFIKAAEAHSARNDHAAALRVSEQAAKLVRRDQSPKLWAEVQVSLGMAHADLGSRGDGETALDHLHQAIAAYRAAQQVYTRERWPQEWAMTQNNLAFSFYEQALRTPGEGGAKLREQAVAAYRLALGVYTRERQPHEWATTQNNLAVALVEQAKRTLGLSGRKLLEEAVRLYRLALDFRTEKVLPQDWAQRQRNLAEACVLLGDDLCAADAFAEALRANPDASTRASVAYTESIVRYHEILFDFAKAFELNQDWLARHPADLAAQSNFIESHLTAGHFAEVSVQLAKHWPKFPPSVQIPLAAIEIAALTGLEKGSEATTKRNELLSLLRAQPADFQINWRFRGTRHFLATDPRFAVSWTRLLQLLDALEQPNRAAIETALAAACWPTP